MTELENTLIEGAPPPPDPPQVEPLPPEVVEEIAPPAEDDKAKGLPPLLAISTIFLTLAMDRSKTVRDLKDAIAAEYRDVDNTAVRIFAIRSLSIILVMVKLSSEDALNEGGPLHVTSWFGQRITTMTEFDRPFKAAGFAVINEKIDGELCYTMNGLII